MPHERLFIHHDGRLLPGTPSQSESGVYVCMQAVMVMFFQADASDVLPTTLEGTHITCSFRERSMRAWDLALEYVLLFCDI